MLFSIAWLHDTLSFQATFTSFPADFQHPSKLHPAPHLTNLVRTSWDFWLLSWEDEEEEAGFAESVRLTASSLDVGQLHFISLLVHLSLACKNTWKTHRELSSIVTCLAS
jgi:hypothetical protein